MSDADQSVTALVREVITQVQERQITFMAASLAYYAFISLLPMLLLGLVVLSIVLDPDTAEEIVTAAQEVLTPEATELIAGALTDAPGRGGATVVSVGVLTWSALKVFRGLDTAFSRVYGIDHVESFVEQVIDASIALVAIGIGIIALVGIGTLAGALTGGVPAILGPLATLLTLVVVFHPLYYVFPDVEMGLTDALPGAVFAAVGWTVLQVLFSIYAAQAGGYALYGIVGGVLLLLTWLYLAAIILLVGATINAVVGKHRGIVPQNGGNGSAELTREDRQLQQASNTSVAKERMTDASEDDDRPSDERGSASSAVPDVSALRDRIDELERNVSDRTVHRETLEDDLKRYVRKRVRRSHARGWGPYLVLLYGTAMTIAAFYYLQGFVAIAAMLVIWLSTLGLYVVMVGAGAVFGLLWRFGDLGGRLARWRR